MEELAASASDDCRRGSLRGGEFERLAWSQARRDPSDENSMNLNEKNVKVRVPDRTRLLTLMPELGRIQGFSELLRQTRRVEAGSEEGLRTPTITA